MLRFCQGSELFNVDRSSIDFLFCITKKNAFKTIFFFFFLQNVRFEHSDNIQKKFFLLYWTKECFEHSDNIQK